MFVIIGTTTADLFILSQSPSSQPGADGFRSSNVVFTDTPPRLLMGGNGGNSAYVLAGLGVPTALCSSVGGDPFGLTLSEWLEARGVNLDGLTRSDTLATSTSVILSSDAANQVVFHHPGATVEINLEDVPEGLLSEAEVLLATSYSLIPGLRSGSFAEVLATTEKAGAITALDIGPAIGDPVTLEEITPLLPNTHYLIGNTHEISRLTGTEDWESAATHLLNAGARNLIIKRGKDGASMRARSTGADVPAFNVAANISVGAGDAFNAGFLCGVQRKLPPEQAIRLGNAVAALVVSGERGVLDAPTWSQVEAFLATDGTPSPKS
jgi:sugar/nucleoside kinase (ribokinase family)